MKHLVRAAGVLLGVLAVVFVVPRLMPVGESLQGYGFYARNEEGNAMEWASLPVKYVDSANCSACHQDKYQTWQQASHRTVNCETCHGAGKPHIEQRVKPVVDTSREYCGVCHEKVLGRRATFPQVDLAKHGGTATCTTCHNPHSPSLKGAPAPSTTDKPLDSVKPASSLPTIPHPVEGRQDCLLCHNASGMKPFPGNHLGRTANVCQTCHQNK